MPRLEESRAPSWCMIATGYPTFDWELFQQTSGRRGAITCYRITRQPAVFSLRAKMKGTKMREKLYSRNCNPPPPTGNDEPKIAEPTLELF